MRRRRGPRPHPRRGARRGRTPPRRRRARPRRRQHRDQLIEERVVLERRVGQLVERVTTHLDVIVSERATPASARASSSARVSPRSASTRWRASIDSRFARKSASPSAPGAKPARRRRFSRGSTSVASSSGTNPFHHPATAAETSGDSPSRSWSSSLVAYGLQRWPTNRVLDHARRRDARCRRSSRWRESRPIPTTTGSTSPTCTCSPSAVWQWLTAHLQSHVQFVSGARARRARHADQSELGAQGFLEMSDAKQAAEVSAFRTLGWRTPSTRTGAVVTAVVASSPAARCSRSRWRSRGRRELDGDRLELLSSSTTCTTSPPGRH